MSSQEQKIIEQFRIARYGKSDFVVVEGIHAFKHAYRFGARFEKVFSSAKKQVVNFTAKIATPQEAKVLNKLIEEVDENFLTQLSPYPIRTKLIALVKSPNKVELKNLDLKKPIVFLEEPHDTKNVGAVIRVSAAYGVSAVCINGEIQPWHAGCIKSASGLHFALPVLKIKSLKEISTNRTIIACDANGENMYNNSLPKQSVLIFGTERYGITQQSKNSADQIISIPMQEKVSSLNLATSVSAVLYGGKFE
jgi:TrmH family RNA methyltransferase